MNIGASMLNALRRMLGSIRARFLFFFVIALALAIAAAEISLHTAAEDVMANMSERTTRAELNQICDQVQSEVNNLLRQMTILEFDSGTAALMNWPLFSRLEVVEIQRGLRQTAGMLCAGFPSIRSVALCTNDGTMMVISERSCRVYPADEARSWTFPDEVKRRKKGEVVFMSLNETADSDVMMRNFADVGPMLCVGTPISGGAVLLAFEERLFSDQYMALARLNGRSVSLLDHSGTVLSSSAAETVDRLYAPPEFADVLVYRQAVGASGLEVVYQVRAGDGYLEELHHLSRLTMLALSLAMLLTAGIFLVGLNRMLRPVTGIGVSMQSVEHGDYSMRVDAPGMDELSKLARKYNGMLESLERLTALNAQAEQQRREYELQALRNQINPHFLYNTLNTIKWMAMMEGSTKVADSLGALGGLLAPLIRAENPLCPLSEELELSRRYLSLMNTRYMTVTPLETDIPEALLSAPVPRLCLQPMLENSLIHGFAPRKQWGTILVRARLDGDDLRLDVIDDGAGMAPEAIAELNRRLEAGERSDHVGVVNTAMRLRLHFGRDCGIRVAANPEGGLCVRLMLKYHPAE